MIIRSTWDLVTEDATVLPNSYCLELVKKLHKAMNLEVGKEEVPSITCSGLVGNYKSSGNLYSFMPEESYQLSLSGLNNASCEAIYSLDLGESLEFWGAKFNLVKRENKITSYEQLYTTIIAKESEPIRQFTLNFSTPTAFANQGNYLPLPIPHLIFRSWLERWNHFASIYLGGDELITYLSKSVRIKRHRLQTRNFQLPRGYIVGFTGNLVLQIPAQLEPLIANVAYLLTCYAAFASTGIKTRLGMGQTSVVAYT